MLDFLQIVTRSVKRDVLEVYPTFNMMRSSDLMIRGGDFYAIWVEKKGLWSTDEQDAILLIDSEIDIYVKENKDKFNSSMTIRVLHMKNSETGIIDRWHKYVQKQCRDNFHMLDEKIIFSNTEVNKEDYASKRLPYPLKKGDISAYDTLMSTLYFPEERRKIEWAIGSIVNGDSKKIQKFIVFYGASGTGKSTVLNIIQQLFDGYYSVFDAKALGSANNSFALEAFKSNPLVAIQHDGDLSKIEDNTRLNSLVSHEMMTVNEKFKSTYANRFKCFLFMGTNKPVKITDAKSGLIRRLIDVQPSGNLIDGKTYRQLVKRVKFELGGIAEHCKEVYESDPDFFNNYIPTTMLGASNDFYNFILDSYDIFKRDNSTTLKAAWEMYNTYNDQAKVMYPYSQRLFKEELRSYFTNFEERAISDSGERIRNLYSGFKFNLGGTFSKISKTKADISLELIYDISVFDKECANCPAQYANSKESPSKKWDNVKTILSDIDTSKIHYVKPPENHIVIDFDIPDKDGNKCLEKNLKEAAKWPPTYAELSKSGKGVHLHYIYTGDINKLSNIYKEHIEIKTFTKLASLRRKLTKCNNLPIATITSGLPLRKEKEKMINSEQVKSEKGLRNLIKRNLNKEIHPGTKPSMDFIKKILDDAYESGLTYDISDMKPVILAFAAGSTHQAPYCLKLVDDMRFTSREPPEQIDNDEDVLIFYDVEVFPNLFLVCWKAIGEEKQIVTMINPKSEEIEELIKHKLIGFNCRRYDNHMLYACLIGWNNEQIYNLSQQIINKGTGFFANAYGISYTDIYDFCSTKQSLKKWEIALNIHHKELGFPWDQPIAEELWKTVADYCKNDVIATEAVWNANSGDFLVRMILSDLCGLTVNDTTNTLTAAIIFGKDRYKTLQENFKYRFLGDEPEGPHFTYKEAFDYAIGNTDILPKGIPWFPGYFFGFNDKNHFVSIYRDNEIGEGGLVYAEPGMYGHAITYDVASMHPNSIIKETLFGETYTKIFSDIVKARICIKHKDFDSAKKLFNGRLEKYLTDPEQANALSSALKIAINSVYGLTAAHFDNPFRDIRNKDNIVAKRGALFMTDLRLAVQSLGYSVIHIKTDSIKVLDPTPEIETFIKRFGEAYGYSFEIEDEWEKICLVNDAVFVGKTIEGKWKATGTQFAVPYVFKTLFSKESITLEDMCETKSVKEGEIYIDMNENLPDVSTEEKEFKKLEVSYKHGKLSDMEFEKQAADLNNIIATGHNYIFVGRVGLFCPIKEGCNGGILYRYKDNKYYAISGTKGYRWLETELVKDLKKENDIDDKYYKMLVDEASKTIVAYGDISWFLSEESYVEPEFEKGEYMNKPIYPTEEEGVKII